MNIKELLTDVINTQGKLDIFHITVSVNHETNQITPILNILFSTKDNTVSHLPFIVSLNGDDLSEIRVYLNDFDRSKGCVTELVYASEEDLCYELSSMDEFPECITNRYRTQYLSKLFESYQYIVEIVKKLETYRDTI